MTHASWPEIFPTVNQPDHEAHLDWTFACGAANCTWETYHRSQKGAQAERERHHDNGLCPYTEVRRIYDETERRLVPAGKSIIEKYWEELDKITKLIMDQRAAFKNGDMETGSPEYDGYLKLQGQAQGLALSIRIISSPHFRPKDAGPPDWDDAPGATPDFSEVSKWALKRYRMNRGEIDFMDTPGCKGYNPMPEPTRELNKTAPKAAAKPARGPKADPKTGKFRAFSDEDREHLRNMLGKGIPEGAIQSMLKLSDEQFEAEKNKINNG